MAVAWAVVVAGGVIVENIVVVGGVIVENIVVVVSCLEKAVDGSC